MIRGFVQPCERASHEAVAQAREPVRMAGAVRHAAIAGREAFLAGRMPKRFYADPSSPMDGRIGAANAAWP